jgi:hypothetical protein
MPGAIMANIISANVVIFAYSSSLEVKYVTCLLLHQN